MFLLFGTVVAPPGKTEDNAKSNGRSWKQRASQPAADPGAWGTRHESGINKKGATLVKTVAPTTSKIMKTYQHTQRGAVIVGVIVGIAAITSLISLLAVRQMFGIVPVLLLVGWLFHSLTIEITEGELRWHFGPGLIRNRVRLTDITSARAVRSWFFEGWGIHWSRFGWLYNVAGCDAVAVRLRNGRGFALGTDQPELLARLLAPLSPQT
jgi:hypothetical protein